MMMQSVADTMAFVFFEFVWLKIDEDGSSPGMGQIVGVLHKPNGYLFQVQWGWDKIGYHHAAELTKEKPQQFTT